MLTEGKTANADLSLLWTGNFEELNDVSIKDEIETEILSQVRLRW